MLLFCCDMCSLMMKMVEKMKHSLKTRSQLVSAVA